MDGSQAGFAMMGLIWAVTFTASTWYLFVGELRMGWAHSRSVARGL
ncbi:hypothetical protein [Aeromicrobium wangtongii]|nr:hypothetical protein [Aeromicrobium wangtongii]MCD9199242.1 hypothetical protein [Aeromicrobium wangtongii]